MQQELDYKIQELVAEHGTDAVYKALYNAGDNDLREDIIVKDNALDEAFA